MSLPLNSPNSNLENGDNGVTDILGKKTDLALCKSRFCFLIYFFKYVICGAFVCVDSGKSFLMRMTVGLIFS